MSDIVGIKVAGTVIFIVSVLIWLITITAVFETKLQDLEGNLEIEYIPFIDQYHHFHELKPCNMNLSSHI